MGNKRILVKVNFINEYHHMQVKRDLQKIVNANAKKKMPEYSYETEGFIPFNNVGFLKLIQKEKLMMIQRSKSWNSESTISRTILV